MRRSTAFVTLLALAALRSAIVVASEQSARLVAQGEVAYHAGRYDEARARFVEAAAADPKDPAAPYGLGLAEARLGNWADARTAFGHALEIAPAFEDARRALAIANTHRESTEGGAAEGVAATPKRWELRAGTGVEYDSNVTLDPTHPKGDAAFLFDAGARYDVVRSPRALVRVDYDFYQSVHVDHSRFDLRSNRVGLTASGAVTPLVWLGAQGGYDHYSLGDRPYLQRPWITPFFTLLEPDRGLTQVYYTHGEDDFMGRPFDEVRDGPTDDVGVNQVFYLGAPQRYLQLGYEYGEDTPHKAAGDPWDRRYHQGSVAVGFPAWLESSVELAYAYRVDDYTEPNAFDARRRTRSDDVHLLHALVRRPITPHVGVLLGYYGTIDASNLGLFDYRRHVVAAAIQVTY